MRDGQTNKQTREDIATQSMDTGKLSFRNMSNPYSGWCENTQKYIWNIWNYSERLMFHLHSEQAFGNSLGDRISVRNALVYCYPLQWTLTWFTAIPRISCVSEQAGGAGAVQVADAKEKLLEVGNKADGMKASCLAAVLPVPATPLGIRWNKNLDKGGFFCAEEQLSFAWESIWWKRLIVNDMSHTTESQRITSWLTNMSFGQSMNTMSHF